ncbi:MAG: FAD:protein FMN transferase [Gemmatimonadota bacterium]|nr:FAD:protein FMN transferase [Gemmatimonadota bacterium]
MSEARGGSSAAAPPRGKGGGLRTVAAIGAVLVLFVLGSLLSRHFYPQEGVVLAELHGRTMGTTWSARVVVPRGSEGLAEAARAAIQESLDAVEGVMSTWDSTSEVSRFNRHLATGPFPVSQPTADVVARALRVGEATGGAFDITVGPLVDLWGFGPGDGPGTVPGAERIARVRAHVGFRGLRVEDGPALRKRDPELRIDLSAIAKGYGVDRAAAALAGLGLPAWAVEVGGEVRVSGRRPDGSAWRIGIEAPDPEERRILHAVEVESTAVATSGDYRNFFTADGERFAHILDPRTGRPVPWRGFSVTVLHPGATEADAWATALAVLGPEEGLEAAAREGIAVLFVLRSAPSGYEELASPAWETAFPSP